MVTNTAIGISDSDISESIYDCIKLNELVIIHKVLAIIYSKTHKNYLS